MTQGGDAAEQIVRLSLEGMEVAVKVSGESAKNIALILMAVLREEHKTKGRKRAQNIPTIRPEDSFLRLRLRGVPPTMNTIKTAISYPLSIR